MSMKIALAAAAVALFGLSAHAMAAGDAAAGEKVFKAQCSACHDVTGKIKVGPYLNGVVGRTAGTVPGFHYSNANKSSGITWTEDELNKYIENPKGIVPGTIMPYPGLKNDQQRADLIAYLATLK